MLPTIPGQISDKLSISGGWIISHIRARETVAYLCPGPAFRKELVDFQNRRKLILHGDRKIFGYTVEFVQVAAWRDAKVEDGT